MKQLCKTLNFITLILFLSVISCQDDDVLRHHKQEQSLESDFVIQFESGDHLRYRNPSVFRKLVKTSQYTKTLSLAKDGTGSGAYSLVLNRIQIIDRNTYTQFTTAVYGHAQEDLYLINYMLIEFDDGSEYQFLIKYPRLFGNQGNGIDYANAIMESIDGETLLHKSGIVGSRPCLDGVPELVNAIQQYVCETTRCTGPERHQWGEQCPCDNLNYCIMPTRTCGWETVSIWSCTGGGGGNDGSTDNTAGGSNNPNESNQDDPIETIPFIPNWERVVDCVNDGSLYSLDLNNPLPLSNEDINWLQSQIGSVHANEISDYISQHGCDDNKTFIDEAIEALRNGGEVDFENELILDHSFVSDTKLKCVYDKLKASNSILFKNTIGNFVNNPNLKITIKKGNCLNTNDACCDDSNLTTTGVVNIIIEDTGGSVLDIASMILHEAIHAEISRYVLLNVPSENPNDKPRILQLYKYYKNLYNEGDIEHIFMTERYINPIASALRKLDNDSYSIDYYKAYAWDGLRKWDANNLLSMVEDQNYTNYRSIVETNTTLSCN